MTEHDDDDLKRLFSELDGMQAPEDLKAKTLEAMLAAAGQTDAEADAVEPAVTAVDSSVTASAAATATPANEKKRAKHKVSRVKLIVRYAVAACLAFACIGGGVAYATPTAYVTLEQGPSVTLAVNCFGFTVSATANDDAGKTLLENANVGFKSYGDSLKILLDTAADMNMMEQGTGLAMTVTSDNAGQSQSIVSTSTAMANDMGYQPSIQTATNANGASQDNGAQGDNGQAQTGSNGQPTGNAQTSGNDSTGANGQGSSDSNQESGQPAVAQPEQQNQGDIQGNPDSSSTR